MDPVKPATPNVDFNPVPPNPAKPAAPPTPPPAPSQPMAAKPPVPPTTQVAAKKSSVGMILGIFIVLLVLGLGGYLGWLFLNGNLGKPKNVTLTWWGLWEPNAVLAGVISDYEKAHPNVKINYIYQSNNQYRERLQNALSQGSGPDIFRLHNSWVPMFKNDLSAIPADVFSASTFESTFYPTAKNDLRVGNSYVAIPLMYDGLELYVNDDLFAASGKTVPTSWEELRNTALALSVCDSQDGKCKAGDKILTAGVAMGTTDNVDHWQDIVLSLMLQNNVNLNAPSGRAVEEALQFYTIFNRTDHIWDSTLPNSTQAFANGKLAMYFGPSWRAHDILAINPKLKFKIYPLPQLPLDPSRNEKPITWATYWAEGVNRKSTNTKEAWAFLSYLSQAQTLQKFYQQAVLSGRAFGEIYPRQDMAEMLKAAPYVGAYVSDAPYAKSWYMASNTGDGDTGIDSLLSKYFSDAINAVNQGQTASEAVKTLSAGVNQVLSRYGIVAAAAVTQ